MQNYLNMYVRGEFFIGKNALIVRLFSAVGNPVLKLYLV